MTIGVGDALGIIAFIVILFCICCREFDPENDFEKRRRKLAKEKKLKDKKAKKDKGKADKVEAKADVKKGGKAAVIKKGTKKVESEDEDEGIGKKKNSKQP